jgi:hypothetical protein
MDLSHWTICFHRGGGGTAAQNAMSAWIRLWTRSPYSHAELYDPDAGLCWSASGWEGRVRFKKINFSHPKLWDFLALPQDAIPVDIRNTMSILDGAKYDYRGALFCGTRFAKKNQDPKKWYCFEAVSRALRWAPWQKTGRQLWECGLTRGWKVPI